MRDTLLSLLIASTLFAAVAPTLPLMEFSSGSEKLNVATALEIHRTGQWAVPTLQGQPRCEKPPLTAWITAALLPQSTLRDLDNPDEGIRSAAYQRLLWDARWPALLASCLLVVAVYALGRTMGDRRLAILAAIVAGTTYGFMRFARNATTDVHLALWVAVANVFFAQAILRGRMWLGMLGGFVALGLAFLSKGPVALVQTLVPVAVLAAWRPMRPTDSSPARAWIVLPTLAGLALFLLIATPWFVLVILRFDAWSLWWRETTRIGARDLEASNVLTYLGIFPLMLPWIVFFISGLGWRSWPRGNARTSQSSWPCSCSSCPSSL